VTICFIVVAAVAVGVGVGLYLKHHDGGGGNIPYVTPPVLKSAPSSLKTNYQSSAIKAPSVERSPFEYLSIDPTQDVIERFFVNGPTFLWGILQGVDDRVSSINDRWSQFSGCMGNSPTAYSLDLGYMSSPTFYAQCAELWNGSPPGFDQVGQVGDSTYLYVHGGAGYVAALLQGNGTFGNIDIVNVWYSVGVNSNGNGSHCVVQVYAQPSANIFEMSVAGFAVGWCGVNLRSDGATLNVTGSQDMGQTCGPIETLCVEATSITTPTTCTGASNDFYLPALGRKQYGDSPFQGASNYPGGALNQVTLYNLVPDQTNFGPATPTVSPI